MVVFEVVLLILNVVYTTKSEVDLDVTYGMCMSISDWVIAWVGLPYLVVKQIVWMIGKEKYVPSFSPSAFDTWSVDKLCNSF